MMTLRNLGAGVSVLALSAVPTVAQIGPPPGPASGASVASVASTCPSSAAATGAVTINGGIGITNITAATDTIAAGDCGGAKTYANASGTAVALPSASSLGAKFTVNLASTSTAGPVTITSSGGAFTSNGTNSLTFAAGQSLSLVSDGTNWAVFAGKGSGSGSATPGGSNGQLQYNNGGSFGGTATGTGVLTALGVNVGSAGAFIANGGALGTPSSGTLTNATGLPLAGLSGLGSGWAAALASAYTTGGSCSGSFCAVNAGSGWTSAIGANLGSGWAGALAAAYSASGSSFTGLQYLGAATGFGSGSFWGMDPTGTQTTGSGNVLTAGATWCSPITPSRSLSLSAIIYRVTTAGSAGSTSHAYIYADAVDSAHSNWHYPGGNPIAVDSNNPTVTTVGAVSFTLAAFAAPTVPASISLAANSIYWKCVQSSSGTEKYEDIQNTAQVPPYVALVGARTAAGSFSTGSGVVGLRIFGTFGTAPNISDATLWSEIASANFPTSSGVISSVP